MGIAMSNVPELKIPAKDTQWLIEQIKADLLISAYRSELAEPRFIELNKKIEKTFETEFGSPIFHRPVTPYHIMGSPGHGKTTCFKVAAKWAAEKLGMNLVVNPTDDYELQENDILMVMLDLSGETSNLKFIGLPVIADYLNTLDDNSAKKGKYTTSAPPKLLQNLQHATVSIFLLDDFSNASPSIQNIGLSVMLEKGYQALKIGQNTFVNSTGNLGALDGTSVSPTSTAMASRRQAYIGFDTVENWSKRTLEEFPDHIGDAGLVEFFRQHPECFSETNKSKKGEGFACPRGWSHFVHYAREAMHKYDSLLKRSTSLAGSAFELEDFITKAQGHVGFNVSSKLKAFYLSLTNEVTPIAKALLDGEKLNETQKGLLEHHSKTGGNTSEFFYSMLTRTLGERVAVQVSTAAKLDPDNYIEQSKPLLVNFSNGMLECGVVPVKLNKISEGFSSFAHKMALLNNSKNADVAHFSKSTHQPMLNLDLLKATVASFVLNPKAHQPIGGVNGVKIAKICCTDVLSNMAAHTSTSSKIKDLDEIITQLPSVSALAESQAVKAKVEPIVEQLNEVMKEEELSIAPPSMF
jgi:hypothetical protein